MRNKKAQVRSITPDPKFDSVKVARLVNYVMKSGKKSVAQKQVYTALEKLADATKKPAVEVFDDVLNSITPQMEVRSRRVGGASYQVPMPVKNRRGFSLAVRWLVQEANKRPNKQYHTFAEKLLAEMLDALNNTGGAVSKKITTHKMADANKAFAHFRW